MALVEKRPSIRPFSPQLFRPRANGHISPGSIESHRRGFPYGFTVKKNEPGLKACSNEPPTSRASYVDNRFGIRRPIRTIAWELVKNTSGRRRLALITPPAAASSPPSLYYVRCTHIKNLLHPLIFLKHTSP
jgi:hypothetical protein